MLLAYKMLVKKLDDVAVGLATVQMGPALQGTEHVTLIGYSIEHTKYMHEQREVKQDSLESRHAHRRELFCTSMDPVGHLCSQPR